MAAHNATTGSPGSRSWRPGILLRGAPAAATGQAAVGQSFNVYRKPSIGLKLLLLLVVIFAAVLIGGGLAMGNKYIAFGILGLLVAGVVFVTPVIVTFWTMLVVAFLVAGPATYFLGISQFQWIPPALDAAEYVQVLLLILSGRLRGQTFRIPGFAVWLAVYLFCALFTSVLSGISVAEAIMASRYNVFVWGALLVFMVGAVNDTTIDQVWRVLTAIAWLQLPMAFYQYKFVAAKRLTGEIASQATPWDAVVGTFPGTEAGGGSSPAMGVFLLIIILLAIARWREGLSGGWKTAAFVLSAVAAIGLAEVKAVVVLIPVVLGIYYYREVLRKPFETVVALAVSCTIAVVLLYGYQKLHYDNIEVPARSEYYGETVLDKIERQLSPDAKNENNDRLGRVTLLIQWWDENPRRGDIQHTLFGYGVGTTQVSKLGVGSLAQQFGAIGRTSLTILLWETGLVGTLAFIMMLLTGAHLASKTARDLRIPIEHRIYLRVGAIGLLLFLLTLPYKALAIRLVPTMLLMIVMMGQAYYWSSRLANEDHRNRLAKLIGR